MLLAYQLWRALKADCKSNLIKKGCPKDLLIKAIFDRYIENYRDLECFREGDARYYHKGEACGTVTKEEEEATKEILNTL